MILGLELGKYKGSLPIHKMIQILCIGKFFEKCSKKEKDIDISETQEPTWKGFQCPKLG